MEYSDKERREQTVVPSDDMESDRSRYGPGDQEMGSFLSFLFRRLFHCWAQSQTRGEGPAGFTLPGGAKFPLDWGCWHHWVLTIPVALS